MSNLSRFHFALCLTLALSLSLIACDSADVREEGEDTEFEEGCDAPGDITIPIDPTATYLRTDPEDLAGDAHAYSLSDLGIAPGDRIRVQRLGEFQFRAHLHPDSVRYGALGVFSSNDILLQSSEPHRVPGAIDVGRDFVTMSSFYRNLPTDIPEDFGLGLENNIDTLTVPLGASFIFVSAHDRLFMDNADWDEDFRFCIKHVE